MILQRFRGQYMLNATRSPRRPSEIRPALTDAALQQLQHEVVGLRTPDLMRTTRSAVALPPGEERSDPFAERGSQRAGARASRASSSGTVVRSSIPHDFRRTAAAISSAPASRVYRDGHGRAPH